MATVYKAYQPDRDRIVAIKILSPQHAQTSGYKERFFREAMAVARLSHPNMLPLYDVGIEDDISYFAMKYVPGSTLRNIMGEPMPLSLGCRLIDQMASALDHAQEHGIIHRGFKQASILLEGEWVLFTDFGIAKIIEETQTLTITGELMETPAYMSPEQAAGKALDHRTDIYSLGVVLFEMVTGQVPFKGNPYGVIFKHVHDVLPLPYSHRPDLSEEVERAILRALAKDPEDRFERLAVMVAVAVQSRWWDQGREMVDELQRAEHQNGAAIAPRLGQLVDDVLLVDLHESFAGKRRAGAVTQQPLQPSPVARLLGDGGDLLRCGRTGSGGKT